MVRRSLELSELQQIEPRDLWAARFIDGIPSLANALGGREGYLDALRLVRTDHTIFWQGKRLHVETYGPANGTQILFHHGYGAYSALYGPFLVLLANQGVNVLAVDRPGHGLSEGNPGDCTVSELAEVSRLVSEAVYVSNHPALRGLRLKRWRDAHQLSHSLSRRRGERIRMSWHP